MSSNGEDGYTSIGAIERHPRRLTRQDILNEKRQRTTDVLPALESDAPDGKLSMRQMAQLRDENRRLRRELEELQRRVIQHREAEAQLEKEIETVHAGHQLEIEQYQNHLREMMDELNQKQQSLLDMEQRYQDLYHSFHEAVEEEAGKLVSEAAQTLVLSPQHTPAILHDVMKTLEFQVKQTEDQHVAEIMALMRQVQRKNEQLEQALAQEQEKIAQERQKIIALQNNVREQGELRKKTIETRLQMRFTAVVTLLTTALLFLLATIQVAVFTYLKVPLYWGLFGPIIICMVLAFIFARIGSHTQYYRPPKQQKKDDKPAGK